MLKSGRFVYVAFMCQQAIEKLAKGIYVYHFDKEAKYTHNIVLILEDVDSITVLKEYKEHKMLFADLTSYYIAGRYNVYKQEISKELNADKAKELLKKSKEAFQWLKSQVK